MVIKKSFRKILRFGAVFVAFLILAVGVALLLFLFDKPLVKNILETQLEKRAGINVRAGKLDYSLFPFRLAVEALDLGREKDHQEWGVSLARLEAKGDFWKLLRGMKPAFETVEAEGAVIRLGQKGHSEKPLDLKAIILQTADKLSLAKRISIGNARLTLSLPSLLVNLENLDISLTPRVQGEGVTFSISRSDLDVKGKNGSFSLRSRLTSSGALRLASSLDFDAAFALDALQFAISGLGQSLPRFTIDSTGHLDPSTKKIVVSRLKIGVVELLDFQGEARGTFSQAPSLEAEGTARFEKLDNLVALLRPRLPAGFRKAQLRGRAILTGKYGIQRSRQGTIDNLTGSMMLERVELEHDFNGLPLHIQAKGKIQAAGPSRAPWLSADILASIRKVALGNLSVGNIELRVLAAAAKKTVNISRFEAAIKDLLLDVAGGKRLSSDAITLKGKADLGLGSKAVVLNSFEARFDAALNNLFFSAADGRSLSFDNVTLNGRTGLDVNKKTMVLKSLEARFPGIAPLFTEGQFGLAKTPAPQFRIESHGMDIPALRALLTPLIPKSLAGWELGGAADLLLEVRRLPASGPDWGFSVFLSLDQAKFNDPSFAIAGEGLNPVLKVEGEYAPSKELWFKGNFDIGQGESLWKAVYVPWSKHPLKTTVAGRCHLESGGMDGLEARFLFPTIGEVKISGSIKRRPSLSFDLLTDARLSLGPLYSLYTEAGVSDENRMTIDGTMGVALHVIREGGELSATGKLTCANANLERPVTKTTLLDVDAELPVHYESGESAGDSPDVPLPEEGFLRVGEFRNSFLSLELVAIPLRVGANAFSIEPFAVDLYGGRAELGRTTFRIDPKSGYFRGLGSLALHDLDISHLPFRSPQFNLTGKIQAEFPKLDISLKEIAISGRGVADVFGGKVILRDLAVSNPFTPGRSFSLNVDLLDLDLKKLTQQVPFGEVTGVVRGEVRNLVFSYKQPERFELRIESVARKGVPQTFSLKAVDNLTVLSAGQQATAGTGRFWMRFIRGFRYQKLGILSTLRNDTFTLNGTIHEGGVEYLVKKSPLSGISVVNRMPKNVISFKEMISRLKRVGQSEK